MSTDNYSSSEHESASTDTIDLPNKNFTKRKYNQLELDMDKKSKILVTDLLSPLKKSGSPFFNEVIKRKYYIIKQ